MKAIYIENNAYNCIIFTAKGKVVIMKDTYTGFVDEMNIQINRDNLVDIAWDLNECAIDEREIKEMYNHAPFIPNVEKSDTIEMENMINNAEYCEQIYEISDWED